MGDGGMSSKGTVSHTWPAEIGTWAEVEGGEGAGDLKT